LLLKIQITQKQAKIQNTWKHQSETTACGKCKIPGFLAMSGIFRLPDLGAADRSFRPLETSVRFWKQPGVSGRRIQHFPETLA
jgi:hypothetical protein